jgi:hypothetical protein
MKLRIFFAAIVVGFFAPQLAPTAAQAQGAYGY